ncbi:hypothetical protein PEC301889_34970 [Pectobacterium carotovorum subsp. carotovorum]|nr:hypothetical protein PEC301889_34970 [Pectobacterium carotovorum subsp. carotovorum]
MVSCAILLAFSCYSVARARHGAAPRRTPRAPWLSGVNYAANAVPSSVSDFTDRLRHVPDVAQAFAASLRLILSPLSPQHNFLRRITAKPTTSLGLRIKVTMHEPS